MDHLWKLTRRHSIYIYIYIYIFYFIFLFFIFFCTKDLKNILFTIYLNVCFSRFLHDFETYIYKLYLFNSVINDLLSYP